MASTDGIGPASASTPAPTGTSFYTAKVGGSKTSKTGAANDALGKDDFMKLLLAQLQHQDPLKPMDDAAFISQVATFNQLEQLTTMNKTLASVLNSQQLADASALIGKVVTATDSKSVSVTGVVTSASIEKNVAMLHVGETKVELSKVIAVTTDSGATTTTTTETSGDAATP